MIVVKAKLLRSQVVDGTYDGKPTRKYVFHCHETDLDGSTIPRSFSTGSLDASKVLEKHLEDKDFHLIPISNARVNSFSMKGEASYTLDSEIILHPEFSSIDHIL
jgi:hypothetical protein